MTDGDVPEGDPDSTDAHEDDLAKDSPTDDAVTPDEDHEAPPGEATDGEDAESASEESPSDDVGKRVDDSDNETDGSGEEAGEDTDDSDDDVEGNDGDEVADSDADEPDDDVVASNGDEETEEDDDSDEDNDSNEEALERLKEAQKEYEEHGAADWDPDDSDVDPVEWNQVPSGHEPIETGGESKESEGDDDTAISEEDDESDDQPAPASAPERREERDEMAHRPSKQKGPVQADPDRTLESDDEIDEPEDETGEGDDEIDQDEDEADESDDGERTHRQPSYLKGQDTEVPDRDPDHAPDDEEMPLAEHVEEMVHRLGIVLLLMAGVSAIVFPFGERIINVIWYSFLPGSFDLCPTTSVVPQDPGAVIAATLGDVGAGPGVAMAESETIKPACPRVYHPLATILARFKVATLAGFVIALPAVVYETYLFMRPGLFPRERRYYLAAVPTSLILAAFGVAFAYLLVLPAIFTYFLYYSEGAADIAFSLTETFDLMVLMLGFFAAIFQIPLFIMLAIMMGITSRQWLADRRLLFWAGFAGVAFIFNPDPTGMAPFIIAATMIALFEGTLLLLSWTGSEGLLPSPEAVEARRPYAWLSAGVVGYLASAAPLPAGFYDQLPGLLRGYIESNGLLGVTPLVVGGLLVAGYELLVWLLNRYLPVGKRRRQLFTGRISLQKLRTPVWIVSLVIGYFASPRPFLLAQADAVALEPHYAVALTVGLIVAFEVLLVVWKYVRPDEDERLPLKH